MRAPLPTDHVVELGKTGQVVTCNTSLRMPTVLALMNKAAQDETEGFGVNDNGDVFMNVDTVKEDDAAPIIAAIFDALDKLGNYKFR